MAVPMATVGVKGLGIVIVKDYDFVNIFVHGRYRARHAVAVLDVTRK